MSLCPRKLHARTYKFGPEVSDARSAKERHACTDLPLEDLDEAKHTRFAICLYTVTVTVKEGMRTEGSRAHTLSVQKWAA